MDGLSLSNIQLERVASLFSVLSEPSRLAILQALQNGPLSVTEIISATGLKQANVSRHLGLLHSGNLVDRSRDGNHVRYGIADPVINDLCALVCDKVERDASSTLRELVGTKR